ncbi:Ankyrin-3 [Trichoderma ghanense]|uniref:Ankyrin-3 n=1 Tax=Trichoderma ghanense TaxID=65468 RepID=A0ABY2H715_9HYPO
MSDSEASSSSSSSDSSRGGSPEPGAAPEVEQEFTTEHTTADESHGNSATEESPSSKTEADGEETGTDPPKEEIDPDAVPLHVSWDTEGEVAPDSMAIDFVVVHGVYGSWEDGSRAGPGSGSSEWVSNYPELLDPTRILRFEYEPLQLFCGRRSRQAIRNCALKLLRALAARRRHEKAKRLIIFVAHDIGGLIVKDALVAANLDTNSWLDIAEMSRIMVRLTAFIVNEKHCRSDQGTWQVFHGSPHRSVDHFDMEDRLSRFLFAGFDSGIATVRPSASAISGFAAAAMEINGLFAESKILLRTRAAFDSYSATLGIPMEKRIPEPDNDSTVSDCVKELVEAVGAPVSIEQLRYEREILALASPVFPLQTAKGDNATIENSQHIKDWLQHRGPQMLYLHGTKRVRETAEQLFYTLEEQALKIKNCVVLYFSFDRYDVRCDSVRDMLATFLAQILCFYPSVDDRIKTTFLRFHEEHGWTEDDLIYWFERFRFTEKVEHVMFVINHFDECTKGSRKQFLENFAYLAEASENSWKVVVTSHKPDALSKELDGPWCVNVDLDAEPGEDSLTNIVDDDSKDDMAHLLTARPELHYEPSLIEDQLRYIEKYDPLVKHVIREQAAARQDWPSQVSIQTLLEPLTLDADAAVDDDGNLEQLLAWVLKNAPEPDTLRRLLTWILYSVRPLTVWELATVLSMGSDDKGRVAPDAEAIDSLFSKIKQWLAGIVVVQHNEVKIWHPRLRNILMALNGEKSAESRFIWGDIKKTAHFDIASFCLRYLSQPAVQEYISNTFHVTDPEAFETPTFADRRNLCSYALQAWTHHFVASSPKPELSKILSQSASTDLASSWARGYWALSNPITRNPVCLDTLFPIFAGLGLVGIIEARDEADTRRGVLEAASKGQSEVVLALAKGLDMDESALMDVIKAAAAYGDEDTMLNMLDRIISLNPKPDTSTWPPLLIHRAAWLGLERFADRILDLGFPTEVETEWTAVTKATPLSQAARNNHAGVVRTLLKHNANVETRHRWDRTVIHHVAGQGHSEIAKILVEEGKIDIEIKDEDGFTTLYFGCIWGHHDVVKLLLDMGADPHMGIKMDDPPEKWSPLVAAIDDGYEKCVRLLLDKGANPNLPGPSTNGTALRYAAVKGHLNICQMLIDSGADPNSPLIEPPILTQIITDYEASERQMEVFDFLLEHNADVNAKDASGTPVLIHACTKGQKMEFTQRLLDHGADVNLLDSQNQSALYMATCDSEDELAKLLVEKGANVNEVSADNLTPLYYAVPDPDTVRILLEKGADPNRSNKGGFSCLMYAAWFNHSESAELLLEHGAEIEATYDQDDVSEGRTSVYFAVVENAKDAVRVLAEHGANLMHVSADGVPIIHHAALSDTLSVVLEYPTSIHLNQRDGDGYAPLHKFDVSEQNFKLLVNAGADVNLQDTKRGDTPLTIAAYRGMLNRVKYLLKRGADIHLGSRCDGAAIHQACRYQKFDVLKYLVENGAHVNQVVEYGIAGTPLQAACLAYVDDETERIVDKMVEYLLAHGADVTIEGGLNGNALNAAACAATPTIIKWFLDKGAVVDLRDPFGRMPIHSAAFHGIDNLEVVLDAGGHITAKDYTGRTALHWAVQPGRLQAVEKIISLLPDKKAVDEPDIDGWTPLCWAARGVGNWLNQDIAGEPQDQIEVMKRLLEKGADRFVRVSVGRQKWTPLKIARFHDASDEVIELLKHGLDTADDKDNKKNKSGMDDESDEDKTKKGNPRGETCDSCRTKIYGFCYHCNDCLDFDLCWKCHARSDLIHSPEHTYEELGPEFEETEDDKPEDDDAASESSGSTTSDSE